ncbi:MAG TPA: nickel-dependent lactate racemase [Atribacteraceae bacterium]|nr:nickel-dependent lactate racemase [Atribacteraceae bacterium]
MRDKHRQIVEIPFGKESHKLGIPRAQLREVLSPNVFEPPDDGRRMIEHALAHPIGTTRLSEFVRRGHRVAILSEDNSRFARTDLMIEAVTAELNAAGVPDGDITVVMALGSHRKMTQTEIIQKLGKGVTSRFTCVNSEFRNPDLLVNVGTAPGNVEVLLDRRVAEADVRIGVGSIVPHPALGYTGGAKILYPGVVGEQTVAQLHLRAALVGRNIMGVVENPVRIEMESWVGTIGLDFIVNSVVNQQNETCKVVAGDYVKAHRAGVTHARRIYEVQATHAVDLLIASSHTADLDLWQATKAIIAGERIVKDGGTLLLYTPCSEGVGPHADFTRYCGTEDIPSLLAEAHHGRVAADQVLPLSVGALVAQVRKRTKAAIVSPGITPADAHIAGFCHMGTSLNDLQKAIDTTPTTTSISVLTHGGECFAVL